MEQLIETKLPEFKSGMTKELVKQLASNAVDVAIEQGNVLDVAEAISAMDEFISLVRKNDNFINAVVEEANKNRGKITLGAGSKIEVCETGVKYDYSQNSEWVELSMQEKEIAERRKAIEERLKTIAPGKMLVDEETGETWIGAPKSSKTNYKLTLAK